MTNFKIAEEGDAYIIIPITRAGSNFIAQYRPYLDYPTKAGAEEAALNMNRHVELRGDRAPFVERSEVEWRL